jgi:dolichyl-phosphate beta-glucosyltransferase
VDLKVIEYEYNKGKGGAIRIGMLTAVGDYMLMVDADGATDINEFQKVFQEMKKIEKNELGLVAGSRNHLVQGVVKKRKFYRNILMYCSNFVIQTICGVKLKVKINENYRIKEVL